MSENPSAECGVRSAEKAKWPHAVAWRVAEELAAALRPGCIRLEVVGSVRRRRPNVGDVELLYVPLIVEGPNPDSLLGETMPVNMANAAITALRGRGILDNHRFSNGSTAYGEKNKLMVHVPSGMPVDLFAIAEPGWWNYLVCRTGGSANNIAIARAAQAKGWQWNPYSAGFSDGLGGVAEMKCELDVFKFVGLPWREPEERE